MVLAIFGLALYESGTFRTPEKQAIYLTEKAIARNEDIRGDVSITRAYQTAGPQDYRVEFTARYRDAAGDIKTGSLVCKVNLDTKATTIQARQGAAPTLTTKSGGKARQGQRATNIAHEKFLSLDSGSRAHLLGKTVSSIGERCTGLSTFFMGLDRESRAYWSVLCANGKSYQVAIQADATGSTRIVDCAVLKAVAKISCFKRLEEQ